MMEDLHPIQKALIYHGAVQCGFCTPGIVMSAQSLLSYNPNPTDDEIKKAISGNLCRCGGYDRIIKAINNAAAVMRGDIEKIPEHSYNGKMIGTSLLDVEGNVKVTGRLKFADDIYFDDMLYGKVLLSAYPHAEILSVVTKEAEKVPGVRLVLTAKDVPGPNRYGGLGGLVQDESVFADEKVRFIGDTIAAVFADTYEIAEKAVRLIKVDYRQLQGVFSPFQAMKNDAPKIHEQGNLIKEATITDGDIHKAFENSDVIVADSYYSPILEHAYMEPEAGVAIRNKDGGITIWYPSQGPFIVQRSVAKNLNLPIEKVRVVGTCMGGAFGGKADVCIEIILGLAALHSGRPVKMALNRKESFVMSTKRHAYFMDYKTGANKDGKLTALQAKIVSDGGAYAGHSADVLEQSIVFAGGPYVWPASHVEGACYYTNNVIGGAFRGFGMNQVHFAVESQMDKMARELGFDPIDFRLENALEIGSRTITGEIMKHSVAIKETLRKAKEILSNEEIPVPSNSNKKIGIGIGAGYKNIGAGRGFVNFGGAVLELKENGTVEACSSACDLGQHTKTVMTQIAAEATGIRYDKITVITGDSRHIPHGAFAIGQRQVTVAGNAMLKASKEFKKMLLLHAAKISGKMIDELSVSEDKIVDLHGNTVMGLDELAFHEISQGKKILAESKYTAPQTYPIKGDPNPLYPIMKDGKIVLDYDENDYRNYITYNYCTQIAFIEVDEQTGEVQVKKVLGFHDVGKAINPQNCHAQLEGSVMMGVGYALSEEFIMHEGINITETLRDTGIATSLEMPEKRFYLIEDPEPIGPFQAKGLSEIALVPTVPAILNAIYDAVGVRISSLPANAEKVFLALQEKEG